MIRNVIFDCGNVLNRFQPVDYYVQLGYEEELVKRICHEMFASKHWLAYDMGIITYDENIRAICKEYPEDETLIHTFGEKWLSLLTPIIAHQQLLDELKQNGYRVYLLSNIAPEPWEYVNQLCHYENRLDGYVLSYQELCCKPDMKLYQILLERYQLIADECLFLDDLPANIEAAKQLGIHGLIVDREDMREWVWNKLVRTTRWNEDEIKEKKRK